PVPSVTSKYDLSLHIEDKGAGLAGLIEYSTDLFKRETPEAIATRLLRLLAAAMARPNAPLDELEILEDAERGALLETFNATAHAVPQTTLPELFEAQAARAPDCIALKFCDESLTYEDLNERVNRLAHRLIEKGVG